MLNCNTCIVGITLLISSVFMTIFKQDKGIFFDFANLLDKYYNECIVSNTSVFKMSYYA